MYSFRSSLAAAAFAGTIGAAAFAPAAQAEANCDWYARLALRQQQQNELKKCGFSGPEWSSELRAHANWCATVGPHEWKNEARKREQMLARCGKK
jgi:hypothetical protein